MQDEKKVQKDAPEPAPAKGGGDEDPEKSCFLARMSHEMRTPLNAIIGMATIAQSSNDPEKTAQCLCKINEASMHLLSMINDILDVAQLEAGNLKVCRGEFNLPRALREAATMKNFTLNAKKQELRLDLDPGLPENIISDEHRLAQILDNLFSNAIKFTPPGGTIALSARKLSGDEKTCVLEIKVSDTGIGISKEGLKKIFALFEQADGGLSRKYGGTGLGLAICARVVQLLGGRMKAESEPGKGSSFSFEISVETGAEKAELPASAGGKAAGAPGPEQEPRYAGRAILLAEDVEINREIILSLLEDTGAVIDCAENGREAADLFRANPEKYRAILMDIHMPEMDGYEATRRIRAREKSLNPNSRQTPIIAMTANVFKEDVEKCLAVGMDSHLGKPIDFEELIKQLDRCLL